MKALLKSLLIDNYDSFTYNLYHLIAKVNGLAPIVMRNDECNWEDIRDREFDQIIISPGPGRPENSRDFGLSKDIMLNLKVPVLGVCLGHQGIAHVFGGKIHHAPEPIHGRPSLIYHHNLDLFENLPSPFTAIRYHSFVVDPQLPADLIAQAWTQDGLIMGLRHRERPIWGVQFHPESIGTKFGEELLLNFKRLSEAARGIQNRSDTPSSSFQKIEHTPYKECSSSDKKLLAHQIICLDVALDPENVVSSFFANKKRFVWLDSARLMPQTGRFSYFADAEGPLSETVRYFALEQVVHIERQGAMHTFKTNIFDYLKQQLAQYSVRSENTEYPFPFVGGYMGYCGYEINKTPQVSQDERLRNTVPDAWWMFVDRFIVIDHLEQKTYLVALTTEAHLQASQAWLEETEKAVLSTGYHEVKSKKRVTPVEFRLRHSREEYLKLISAALEAIRDGESYELCLTNSITANERLNSVELYRALRRLNAAPFGALILDADFAILSSSPERFLKLDSEGHLEARPIKGTRPRERDQEKDNKIKYDLATSEKDLAENRMIVDLLRNDIGRVAKVGSVRVPRSMDIETFATVHQLVSTITGALESGMTSIDAFQAAFPGGSMTGAPKIRTMEILAHLEQAPRGVYSGALGWLGLNNEMDLSIVIRTIVQSGNELSIGCGGAIVAQSNPENEYQEMLLKATAPMQAIALAVTGDKTNFRLY